MRARLKNSNKVLDIVLSEEKYYFPGETIRGSIIVKPKSSMKVNPLIIKFSGVIYIAAKEKEVIPLFQTCKLIPINKGKSKLLEAKLHSFPFEFVVPDNLPSAMDFEQNKIARIHYKLTAILDKPMVPESLCPKFEYPVLVLEYVDVTKGNFVKPLEKQKEVVGSNRCHVKLSVPRTGFTRGETVPVNIVVNTFQSFVRKDSLVVELVRKVKIQSNRNSIDEELVLKSSKFDLNIIGPYNFSQSITSQLLIRATPPTICYKDKILRIYYKIRAQVFTADKSTPSCVIELPIVIGTWPLADVPIDDDDDEDIIQNMGEVMIGDQDDDDEEDDDWMEQQEELEFKRHNSTFYNNHKVKRTGSNGSSTSMSSWMSQSTMDRRISAGSPTVTATCSTSSNNTTKIPDNYHRNTLPPPIGFNVPNNYLNRSSSTPDLLNSPPMSTQQNRTRIIDPTLRASYYDQSPPSPPQSTISTGHRSSHSIHSIQPSFSSLGSPSQQHHRVGSEDFQLQSNEPGVPNHTLTFLSSSTPTTPHSTVTQQHSSNNSNDNSSSSSSSSDSDFDEDDLFAIIEKKKKREEKELKKRQRIIYTLAE